MLNQVLLLYYPTRHTWLTLSHIVSVVLCHINLPLTYTEHCASPGGVRDGGGAPRYGNRITGAGE